MIGPPFEYDRFEEGRHLNYWEENVPLRREAERVYPESEFEWAEDRLSEFGEVVGHTIADNADVVDDHGPEIRTYDRYGELSNDVIYHPAQFENERLVYESGIIADAFSPPSDREAPVGLLHTLTMQLLLSYVDVGLVCAQSMTAGAALVLRNHDRDGHFEEYLAGLTAREYEDVIEGGMFLTEEQGGSDVGANETIAEPVGAVDELSAPETESVRAESDGGRIKAGDPTDGEPAAPPTYELTGEKWFCSNIDAQATLALARRPDAPAGTGGLSMFLVPHELPDGELNHQIYRRLKDKLGTESVPTGEVEFDGTTAYLVGEPERGFKYMTTMLNYERVTNAVGAVGVIARALLESKIHAANREAFGEPIASFPLMQRDLVELSIDHEAALAFAMAAARWYDRYERDHDDERAFRLLRLLVPIAKHRTARMAVRTSSYAMEVLGGNGYVEEFITHRLYRDVHALPIWEGTSNILSLDVLRAMEKEHAHEAFVPLVEAKLESVSHPFLRERAADVRAAFERLQESLLALAAEDDAYAQYEAKELADYIFDVLTAALLLEAAQHEIDEYDDARKAIVADLFVRRTLVDADARGITDGETPAMAYFDSIVRYDRLDPDTIG